MAKRIYSWKPDLPDARDYTFKDIPSGLLVAKRKVADTDLRPLMTPVDNQGNLGSCTGHALSGDTEYLEKLNHGVVTKLSRMFIYYNERVIEGTVNQDSGAMIRDGIKTLAKQGVCTEKEWPYKVSKFKQKPPATCYKSGLTRIITSYHRLSTISEMETALASGLPFVFGFTVYDSFESDAVAKTGVVPMPKSGEKALGGHAVCAVGFQKSKKRFIVRNSWGTDWGDQGYFYMPYAYLADRNLSDDFWVIVKEL